MATLHGPFPRLSEDFFSCPQEIYSLPQLDERQQPVFQVQMHMRVPFPEGAPLDAVLATLGIAGPPDLLPGAHAFYGPNRSQALRIEL